MTTSTPDVVEAKAEAIDPPRVLGEADKWLAEKRAQVEEAAKGLLAFEITDAEGYKDSKRQRAAVRSTISAIDSERKSMTAKLTAALKDFKAGADAVLAPLSDLDGGYKAEQVKWETKVLSRRRALLETAYAEDYPDVASHVPFQAVCDRFAQEGKWDNVSTNDEKALASLRDFIDGERGVMSEIATIDAMNETDEYKDAVKASYFADLDLNRAMVEVNAQRVREAKLARERAEREEWERAQREELERQQAAHEEIAARQANVAQSHVGQPAPEERKTYYFEFYLTAGEYADLMAFAKRRGIHGKRRKA